MIDWLALWLWACDKPAPHSRSAWQNQTGHFVPVIFPGIGKIERKKRLWSQYPLQGHLMTGRPHTKFYILKFLPSPNHAKLRTKPWETFKIQTITDAMILQTYPFEPQQICFYNHTTVICETQIFLSFIFLLCLLCFSHGSQNKSVQPASHPLSLNGMRGYIYIYI
jgi:hypothetical protein